MKRIKLSFAAVIAILVGGVTLTSNAKTIFGKRLLTGCFRSITMADFDGSDAFTPTPANNNCEAIKTTILYNGRKYLAGLPLNITNNCQINLPKFCCVVLEAIPIADEALFPDIHYYDLDTPEGYRKWRAIQVQCRVN